MASSHVRAGVRWFAPFTVAWLALWTVQLTPLQLLIPLQLNTPDDADGWIWGVLWAGLVLAAGGLVGVVAGPVSGGLSDRTRGARRRPWMLFGVGLAVVSLVVLAFADGAAQGPWVVGAGWIGVSAGTAVASSAFTALIADQLTTQRGAASAAVSSSQALGVVLGVGLVVLLGLGVTGGYLLLAGFLAVAGVVAALVLPDPAAPEASAVARRVRTLRDRTAVLRDRDFLWLLIGRLVVNVGNALGTGLLLYFLMYGLGHEATSAEDELLLLIVVYTVFVVAASILSGVISDRTGRRIGIVVGSACVQGVAGILLAIAPSLETALVSAALLGIGYGAYMSAGLALGTDLLPFPDDHARDLGFVNVSASLGQLLGPLVGAALVWAIGGFGIVFAASAVFSIVGGVMTLAIREPASTPASPERDPAPR